MAKKQSNPVADFDRSSLSEKTRVFTLAKQLGVPSKDLVVALGEMGLVKVAQSTLTKAEAETLLDALAAGSTADTDPKRDKDADEKIRNRVRKDVENEIHQIEEKVDAELALDDDTAADDEPTDDEPPLTDVEPDVTPAPEEEQQPANRAPLFKAPSRSQRRRATRAAKPAEEKEPVEEVVEKQSDNDEPVAIKGSSRLEAQRRRRSERREEQRKRSRIVSQAEFLARRESVERHMVVRERDRHDGHGRITQVGVLEDGLLVEHFVTSDAQASMIGNIYLGRVQNVLPSMEAAFIDIGQGRNGVLYASEVDWKSAGLGGRSRRIEHALKSGDQVLVQVTKDPIGHKGARLSTQISLAGRYLVYVPGGRSAGISRKLPAPERKRLKEILAEVVPGKGGAIIRTAAEGVSEEAIAADVNRLHTQWTAIQEQAEKEKNAKGAKPVTLYEEPNLLVKVVRDLFNEDFTSLIIDGKKPWNTVHAYVKSVAPDLLDRVEKYDRNAHDGKDAFEEYRVDEQIAKALSRTVWLPSGGTLVIDRTEAMTVIDVNTGKFTGSGGSLEETVTSNNLEAAEEIVRQIRLRDIGGMIIIDFIDMILPENQELVLRRLNEALGRDRTRHQVSEVTSLGLVQMTRKRLGTGLLETFSTPCDCCGGRGVVLSDDPVEPETKIPDKPARPRKSSKPKPKPSLNDDEMDDLLDSIFSDTPSEKQPEKKDDDKPRRKRGRRGGNRGRGRAEAPEQPEQQEQQPADEPQSEQSYEEAVAEFESSPRRKRRTRGNSRSDHKPRREDFEAVSEQPKKAEKPEKSQRETRAEVTTTTNRRGRRRAVRKTNPTAQQAKQPAQGRKRERQQPEREARRQASTPRRGRRRATRRSGGRGLE
ncbi:translation initiation factor IF-2 N-terminal domain-containing protein [Corynebacterium lujinxingii]|uniref:Ribonuclease E n=1 Tax=Corynebacterium lujinxingii TaxID=2763010 RepID=A0A7H0JXN8_9CORY|nr:translation initiation factor IF-2 N-terminal domain-containing protein [Corynebacterium lujinxingii]MBC3177749.1 translation initiation factor IF-2 N-terminal domain-containing protein [Corynebacterium lujinxingii]NNO10006.1 Rne/Rng family ribonuclease [Corynebacterium lujinxingii]QNP89804.1 translation initiation factor IF-2 N-terminal domain-containing protein [Corynebacterium lujinxingii]